MNIKKTILIVGSLTSIFALAQVVSAVYNLNKLNQLKDQKIVALEEIVETQQVFRKYYQYREEVKKNNDCQKHFGSNCVFFMFDDLSNCMGVTSEDKSTLTVLCRDNKKGTPLLFLRGKTNSESKKISRPRRKDEFPA
jgi:hypothetical protein